MRNFLFKILTFSILTALFSCQSSPVKKELPPGIYDFPNVLNLIGLPDSTADRSVFAFSDLGAWHAYGLPDPARRDLSGSFTGPFLMTQDNGVWISPVLSRLEIIDVETGRAVDFSTTSVWEANSFPGKLRQVFYTKNPELRVVSELIFISGRSSLTRVFIENPAENQEVKIRLRWSGNSFLKDVRFSKNEASVKIGFSKNENIGMITAGSGENAFFNKDGSSYEITTAAKTLKNKEIWNEYLVHTFCFSKKEWEDEQVKLGAVLNNPEASFTENEARWNGWIEKVLPDRDAGFGSEEDRRIAVKCLETLVTNWRSPAGALQHEGLFPSYNYEWFQGFWSWDSWKHAVALARFHPELAKNQIRAMYDFQDEAGMIADCVYRDNVIEENNWRDTKPPLSGWAVWEVFEQTGDRTFLEELFPKLEKYHHWWYEYRDHDRNGLCEYGSTDGTLIAAKWESGMDNAVRFDDTRLVQNNAYGWSMNRESVDLNSYLFAEKNYLARIAESLGDTEKAARYKAEAEALKVQIQTLFFDETTGWFYDIDLETKAQIKTFGPEGWTPLWTKAATPEQAEKVRRTMLDTNQFATFIPFPTLSAVHPKFTPQNGYWRGPIWLDQVYFAINSLKNYGYDADAAICTRQVLDRLAGLKDDAPIFENYHPLTGEGMEARHFSWSAAHLLLLLED